MTVVIDCNILVMCLTSRSPYHSIYTSLIQGKYRLGVSGEILLEYQEIITEKYGAKTANALIALLRELPNVQFSNPSYKWNLIEADPDDNKYCDCAVACQAAYIVTQDRHFNVLSPYSFPPLETLSIDQFVKLLER